jgi:hypothetical protein
VPAELEPTDPDPDPDPDPEHDPDTGPGRTTVHLAADHGGLLTPGPGCVDLTTT